MIVKIENLEQEKYILECAGDDGLNKSSNIVNYQPPQFMNYSESQISVWCRIQDIELDQWITFEQFKAQREEPIKTGLTEAKGTVEGCAMSWNNKQTNLEKENEELKKKLGEIESYCKSNEHLGDSYTGEGYRLALKNITKRFFQTPSQTEANEIIKNASTEVLEELKKLL